METIAGERWVDIDGYPDYQVSDQGRVRSQKRGPWKLLKPAVVKGYLKVGPYRDDKQVMISVHVLVARAFVKGYSPELEVNHIDGDKANPVWTNLEWATKVQNAQHSRQVLGNDPHKSLRKPVALQQIATGQRFIYRGVAEAARAHGIQSSSLCAVLAGRFTQTRGFTASFIKEQP